MAATSVLEANAGNTDADALGGVGRFASVPAETAEEIDELLAALLEKHADLDDGKWVKIDRDFQSLSKEKKSKQWLKNRSKKLAVSRPPGGVGVAVDNAEPLVAIERTEKHGRVLVARRAIPQMGVVVAEHPLIIGGAPTGGEHPGLDAWCKRERVDKVAASKVEEFLRAFCSADVTVRAKVLQCYHPERFNTLSASIQAFVRFCSVIEAESWVNDVDKATLEKVVVIKLMNAHPFSTKSMQATAVFEHISVPTNSCSPNAVYTSRSSEFPGQGCLIARKPIAVGEQVTLSYCESMIPRSLRLEHLEQAYSFRCDCSACTRDGDLYGCVPCPSCNKRMDDGTLPDEAQFWHDRPGFVYSYPVEESEPWICDTCGGKFPASAVSVCGMSTESFEKNLSREHHAIEAHLDVSPEVDLEGLMGHYATVCRALGPRHGIALQAMILLCNVLIGNPNHDFDSLERGIDALISVLRRNGEHPGEMLPFLIPAGHVFVRRRRFEKAKALYEVALEFNMIYGAGSAKVKEAQRGLQACAKSDPRLVRGL
eukprot:TRINITY_DN43274_c0_g1_i1.p1 TRINITY_DN43274_c0_g1~~TRINITY_DN43274_c0_g1_i1.p1  ORF type:complete len:551 (-),score=96.88 TRINITY_DN43274_c0_g1_i1:60-1682(-)